jgi:hypothetical protein
MMKQTINNALRQDIRELVNWYQSSYDFAFRLAMYRV